MNRITSPDILSNSPNKEGNLFKILNIYGIRFEIYYGYYEDCERENSLVEPMPIYPDFLKEPQFTSDGLPFVTKMQDACRYYKGNRKNFMECAECEYYENGEDLIGVCTNPTRKGQV